MAEVKIYGVGVGGGGGGGTAVMVAGVGAKSTLRCGAFNTASGDYSMAWGKCATASGCYSTASGYCTTASGYYSTASGYGSTSSGKLSTASGAYTTASCYFSNASGRAATASNFASTASGYYTIASGNYSTASGYFTTANSRHSTASGYCTTASNYYSTASGRETTASGVNSTASGFKTTASGNYSIASGRVACASLYGQRAYANGSFSRSVPDAQSIKMVLRQITPNATPLLMYLDGTSQNIVIKPNSMLLLNVFTSGIETTGNNVASSQDYVVIKNVAGTTTLVHQSTIKQHFDSGGLAITISANDTTDTLDIQVTGTATTMRWVSYVTGTEILYAT